ncbi:hypothetical protein [Roseisolibacter sp. H3M3-2]|uniref:hypothetical protein n=1 Tax=Roseisolibacter sp. H3M3-2 TaxID=3031323 RepID=UPI0023DA3E18|nr:hypothetical protein [Roseisolibacter sp. H3M3-2]MDF1505685.1 hypothetical protein [Roseisolibacter sp. H3M3-2]
MFALRALLTHLVDYAGLFPPAGLAMGPAVRKYAAYRAGDAAWMLARFVVPVARLEEFEAAAGALLPFNAEPPDAPEPWRLSALVGADAAADLRAAVAFNARHAEGTEPLREEIDALEAKAASPGDVARLADAARDAALADAALFVELPWGADASAYARAAAAADARLKLRTGGVTPDAFPPAAAVLDFLAACAAHGVAAKCTAGLHHPLRGEHALTYEDGCARGTMYGFVGVFLAAAPLHAGHVPAAVAPLLEERDPGAFAFDAAGAAWRGLRVDAGTLADARVHRLAAFGSCSFEEPLHDLQALGWWPGATPP